MTYRTRLGRTRRHKKYFLCIPLMNMSKSMICLFNISVSMSCWDSRPFLSRKPNPLQKNDLLWENFAGSALKPSMLAVAILMIIYHLRHRSDKAISRKAMKPSFEHTDRLLIKLFQHRSIGPTYDDFCTKNVLSQLPKCVVHVRFAAIAKKFCWVESADEWVRKSTLVGVRVTPARVVRTPPLTSLYLLRPCAHKQSMRSPHHLHTRPANA